MKHNFIKIVAVMTTVVMCLSMVAMAAADIDSETTSASGTYTTTVDITGVGTKDEVSLLVVKAGTDLTKLVAGDVLYIDQKTASKASDADTTGSASFTFSTSTNAFDVYSGYSAMALTDNPLSIEYDGPVVTGPTVDTTASYVYDIVDPYDLTGYSRVFIKLTENNGQWTPTHNANGSAIFYATERAGYDGLVNQTGTIDEILANITWAQVSPSADATIAMYGDIYEDELIDSDDEIMVKQAFLEEIAFTIKQNLISDVYTDGLIDSDDEIEIKRFFLEQIAAFDVSGQ